MIALPSYFPPKDKLIIVGMSGGVDSSVTAAILKNEGYRVVGLFMKNWEEEDESGVCQASKEYHDVERVCEQIDIPVYSVEFIKEYRERVFQNFLDEYKAGHTPNPDILCNKEIKFDAFFKKAKELGADYIATGHYCQSVPCGDYFSLVKGRDDNKDQSYFLYTLKSEILKEVLFPIGHLSKPEVRELASKWNLPTKDKKDSTGICFIGERNFKNFLSQYLESQKGFFQTLDGNIVGEHSGACYYTIGQRKGLGLGGPGLPWYVVAKDIDKNIIFVERGEGHPSLYRKKLTAFRLTWINPDIKFDFPYSCRAKIRYRQKDQECVIVKSENKRVWVEFLEEQKAMTLRQSIVFYSYISGLDTCLGGGMIETVGPHLLERNTKSGF